MPDPFRIQEHLDPCLGIYAQPSEPGTLQPMFFKVLHNMTMIGDMLHVRPGRRKINGALFGDGTRTMWGMATWRGSPDKFIVASGTLLQSMPAGGGDPTALTTNYPSGSWTRAGARTTMVQLGNQIFIVNGTDPNIKYNGTNLTRMGLVAPASLSAPTKSAGALNGTFSYKATLISSTTNSSQESEPTAALAVSYADQQGTFSSPTVPSSDPQIDRWFLYRIAAGGSTYFRVNTTAVTLATTIADNLTDDVLIVSRAIDTSGNNAVPPGKFTALAPHQGRLAGVIATDANTLYWSDLGLDTGGIYFKPEAWPAVNRLPFGDQGGTLITALVSFYDWLIVFQDFGVWSIQGDLNSVDNRTIAPVLVGPDKRGAGVSEIGNIAVAENHVYFTAKDGVYHLLKDSTFTSRVRVEKVSNHIEALYQKINFSAGGTALYDRDGRRYILWGKGLVS